MTHVFPEQSERSLWVNRHRDDPNLNKTLQDSGGRDDNERLDHQQSSTLPRAACVVTSLVPLPLALCFCFCFNSQQRKQTLVSLHTMGRKKCSDECTVMRITELFLIGRYTNLQQALPSPLPSANKCGNAIAQAYQSCCCRCERADLTSAGPLFSLALSLPLREREMERAADFTFFFFFFLRTKDFKAQALHWHRHTREAVKAKKRKQKVSFLP